MENLAKIVELAQQAKENGTKLYDQNVKKYGTETRNVLMEIKKLCDASRKEANEYRKQMPTKKAQAGGSGKTDKASKTGKAGKQNKAPAKAK